MGFISSSGNGSSGGAVDSYTKTESDDKFATKNDLNSKANSTDLANKADTGVSYTKTESDGKYATTTALAGKANTGTSYTKAESDAKYGTITALNLKANTTDLANKADVSTTYTKTETDTKFATITALNAKANSTDLATKANVADTYTKTESDAKYATITTVNTKANSSNVYTKTESDNKYPLKTDLTTKANVGDSYTKTESDSKYAPISSTGGSSYDDTALANRVTAVETTNATQTTDITNLTTRVSASETKITSIESVNGYLEADIDSTVWTTGQLPADTYNVIPFNRTITGSGLNASYEYVAPKTGTYQINSRVWVGSGTAGELIQFGVYVNGVNARTTERLTRAGTTGFQANADAIVKLTAGDKLAIRGYAQTSVLKLDGLFATWTYLNIVQIK